MFSSKVIKIKAEDKIEYQPFSLKSFNTGLARKNQKALEAAGIYCDLKDGDIASLQDLINKTKESAEKIISESRKQADIIKEQAYQTGLEQGLEKGQKRAESVFDTAAQSLKKAADEMQRIQDSFDQDHQDTLIKLAMTIARKIVNYEIAANPEFVLSTIKSAVKMTMDREKLKIRIHPDDMDICHQKKPGIIKDIDGIKTIEFLPDIAVNRGGAIIEYVMGEIDARIERQFIEIEKEIFKKS